MSLCKRITTLIIQSKLNDIEESLSLASDHELLQESIREVSSLSTLVNSSVTLIH